MIGAMFGLFLHVCYTDGTCEYVPQGWVYPDKANCLADMRQQGLFRPRYDCLPVDGIMRPASEKFAGAKLPPAK